MAQGVPVPLIPWRARLARALLAAGLLAFVPGPALPATATSAAEWELKAAFLPKLPLFVQWPAGTFKAADDPLVIGVFGGREAPAQLEQAVSGRIVGGRPLRLVHCHKPADARNCQIVFLAVADTRSAATLLQQLEGCHALTVSDVPNFTDEGGMVTLVAENKRIRLEVNIEAVRRAELRMDPQLLQVAKPGRTAPKGGS